MPPRKSKKSIGHYQKKGILPFCTHEIRPTVPENHFSKNNFPQASFCKKQIFNSSIREAGSGNSRKSTVRGSNLPPSKTPKRELFFWRDLSFSFSDHLWIIWWLQKPKKTGFLRTLARGPYGPYQTNDNGFHKVF